MIILQALLVILSLVGGGFMIYFGLGIIRGQVNISWGKLLLGLLTIIVGAIIIPNGFGQIEAGYRGVVLSFGAPTGEIKQEGLYFILPLIQRVEIMSVQVEKYESHASASSEDLQSVTTQVTLNYQLNAKSVDHVYQNLRRDYEVRIISPLIAEAIKATTAKFTAEELITKRPEVRNEIEEFLSNRLKNHGIAVTNLSITDFKFSDVFNSAIEAKVTAEQEALKAKRDLDRIKTEAQQKIEQARAEAEALRLQKENISEALLELRKIEAQKAAIAKWDGKMPGVVTGNGPVPLLDVFQNSHK